MSNCKLTPAQVKAIRLERFVANTVYRELAEKYHVKICCVHKICTGISHHTTLVFHFGLGYTVKLPAGWTLIERSNDFAVGVSPDNRHHFLTTDGLAYRIHHRGGERVGFFKTALRLNPIKNRQPARSSHASSRHGLRH